ncbi:MAG: hypothetical protein ACU826_12400, partial [Gammaproteobacteria bacterium]
MAFRRLDLMLHREILRLRSRYQLSSDEFRGLYISDEQVDNLIGRSSVMDPAIPSVEELNGKIETLGKAEREQRPRQWRSLIGAFRLSEFECDVLLFALALESDLKYET